MKIKWQKKNSAWSRYGSRCKQTTINQSLVSSSAQAQLHQAPVNGLENDLFYQVTCTYNIRLLNGCAAWVREMREQGMMERRERTPSANPLYPIHPSMCGYIRFSPLNDPQDAVPVSRDWSTIALSRICVLFWIPQRSLLKSSYPKKYLPKFSYPKSKISNPPKILPASLSLQIQSTLFVLFRNFFFNMAHNMRLNSARFPSLDSFTEIEVFQAP